MSKAEAIVNYRNEYGKFKHIDELVNVKGIGIRTVDINREYILLDNSKLADNK
jgi:competence protein ComEA